MNILMALSQLQVTGAEVYAVEIAEKLIEKGHNLFFVSDTLTKKTSAKFIPLAFNKRNPLQRVGHVLRLVRIIRENKIDLVHAHSRASAWSVEIACKLTNTAFVTSIHGMQHQSKVRTRKQPVGRGFAVCENIRNDLIDTFNVPADSLEVLRNGIDMDKFNLCACPDNAKKVISIIGRLSGPKGDITHQLLSKSIDLDSFSVNVVGGEVIPEKFNEFIDKVNFTGYVDNVLEYIKSSDLVIGAGRVAMESLLMGRPTLAIGEAFEIGVVDQTNIEQALASNFGDVGNRQPHSFDWQNIRAEVTRGLSMLQTDKRVIDVIKDNYSLDNIVATLENVYQHELVYTRKFDIPVIMYHRVIRDPETESGKHGTYITESQFTEHLQILKDNNFITITLADLAKIPLHKRFEKKYIILTFDDGYQDNYTYAFPILKKFACKAVIFLVSNTDHNEWDVTQTQEKVFKLMTQAMLGELKESGLIEFGGHTLTHPRLSTLTDQQLHDEIVTDKLKTEEKLNIKLTSFAYPYGDLDERVKKVVHETGYDFAVSTDSGSAALSDDLLQIRRIAIFPSISAFGFKRKIKGNYNFIKVKRELKKLKKKAKAQR